MCRYRVIFFKVLLGIDGHPDKYLQQSIVIRRARSAPNVPLRLQNVGTSAAAVWLTGGFMQTASKWKSIC